MRPYEKMVGIISRELSANPGEWFDTKRLAAKVISETNAETNARGVALTLEVMKALGHVLGHGTRYRFRTPEESGDPTVLKDQLRTLTETVEKLKEERDASESEIAAKYNELLTVSNEKIRDLGKQLEAANGQVREIKLKDPKGKIIKKITGLFHKKFSRLITLAEARKNIFLYGPTGSGKSFICGQVAEALNLPFSMVSCTAGMSESVLTGKLLPVGTGGKFEYVISEFVNRYENGGVFLLDEMDAADNNVMLIINSALASDHMVVTNRSKKAYAKRHKDFICIAACNTVGTGADRQYTGRNKLDASTLDRFGVGKVYIDYDPNVETQLCPDDELRIKCWKIRKAIMDHRLERAMSTRFIADAYVMKHEHKWGDEEMFNCPYDGFFAGWREDEINKVKHSL